jgi:hypothetical protein
VFERFANAAGLGRSLVWLLILILIGIFVFKQLGINHPLVIGIGILTLLYAAGILATSIIALFEPTVRSNWWRF